MTCMKITITADGTATSILAWGGDLPIIHGMIPGTIPGIMAVGTAPGITAAGIHPGITDMEAGTG